MDLIPALIPGANRVGMGEAIGAAIRVHPFGMLGTPRTLVGTPAVHTAGTIGAERFFWLFLLASST